MRKQRICMTLRKHFEGCMPFEEMARRGEKNIAVWAYETSWIGNTGWETALCSRSASSG